MVGGGGGQLVEGKKGGKQALLIQVKYGDARVLRSEQHTTGTNTGEVRRCQSAAE